MCWKPCWLYIQQCQRCSLPTSGSLGVPGTGPHQLNIPLQSQHEMAIMGKPYRLYGGESMLTGLEELRGRSRKHGGHESLR